LSTLTNRNIEKWDAEDVAAWEAGGKDIAKRNLIWSVVAEHVGFSIWSIWSVMVLFMPTDKFGIDLAGKFFLVAMPTLVGAFLRIPYTVATAKFGGRNWTIFSALLLLIPTLLVLRLDKVRDHRVLRVHGLYVLCALVAWAVFLRRPSGVSDSEVVSEAEALVLAAESEHSRTKSPSAIASARA
jgi:hypothetical protein